MLAGYCGKESLKYGDTSKWPCVLHGYTTSQVQDNVRYYKTKTHTSGGPGCLKDVAPNQHHDAHVMNLKSMGPDTEYFEQMYAFEPLRLSMAKTAGLMVSEDFAVLDPSVVTSTAGPPDPVRTNLWWQLRKKPRLGRHGRIMNKIIHGADYDSDDDRKLDQVLDKYIDGPRCAPHIPTLYIPLAFPLFVCVYECLTQHGRDKRPVVCAVPYGNTARATQWVRAAAPPHWQDR